MFCKDVRCEWWGFGNPPIEIGGYKMLDVIRALNEDTRNNSQLHHEKGTPQYITIILSKK
jgi:hypothetical protein